MKCKIICLIEGWGHNLLIMEGWCHNLLIMEGWCHNLLIMGISIFGTGGGHALDANQLQGVKLLKIEYQYYTFFFFFFF